jgi:hypothetical protein
MVEVRICSTGEKKLIDIVSIYGDGRVQLTVDGTDEFVEPGTALMIADPNREETARVALGSIVEG